MSQGGESVAETPIVSKGLIPDFKLSHSMNRTMNKKDKHSDKS